MSENQAKKVSLFVLSGTSMMTLAAVMDPLRAANRHWKRKAFEWQLLSPTGTPIQLTNGVEIAVDGKLDDAQTGDILAVVAGFNQDSEVPASLIPLVRRSALRFKTILSIEAGTWILARAGLLHGHSVTTHWEDLENLQFNYPDIAVLDQRYVVDDRIWSAGGASATLDLMLQYLRTHLSKSLAMDVANVFSYNDFASGLQTAMPISVTWLDRVEPRLAHAVRIMEGNLESPLSIPDIAGQARTSVRTLEHLYKRHLNLSPGAYYLRARLQTARRLVLDTNDSMVNISVRTGFNSPSSFSRAFKTRFDMTPQQMRKTKLSPTTTQTA